MRTPLILLKVFARAALMSAGRRALGEQGVAATKPTPATSPAAPAPADEATITNSIGMKLTLVPAGAFLMGSPDSDADAFDDEKPQHRVRISRPFYLGAYPVTQGEYERVMSTNPGTFSARGDRKDEVAGQDTGRFPVETVSWDDAVAFCNTLSEREGLTPYYRVSGPDVAIVGGGGYRLPTEAEWEYACRAGTTTKYSFGDDAAELGAHAWFGGNSEGKTHPVGQKRANGFGLYDMHGNVWEWCWDGSERYQAAPAVDPSGPLQATVRVDRGGGWDDDPRFCRSASRRRGAPGGRHGDLGLRVARVPSGP